MKYVMPIILLLTIFSTVSFAEGRGPAVEPITGISIDEEPNPPPSKVKGYDFTIRQRRPQSVEAVQNESGKITPALIITFLLLLPFIIRFGILKNLTVPSTQNALPSNTVDISEIRQKKEEGQLPKAS